jgi:hypothetical protein
MYLYFFFDFIFGQLRDASAQAHCQIEEILSTRVTWKCPASRSGYSRSPEVAEVIPIHCSIELLCHFVLWGVKFSAR